LHQLLEKTHSIIDPICTAVSHYSPFINYCRSKVRKGYQPISLYPKTVQGIAMKWILEAARAKTYIGGRPDIRRGLFDEFDSLLKGNSALITKRFNMHRNPN
jgi:ribosomal protein S7